MACSHENPEQYGASQVLWTDRENGVGTLIAPCEKCGDVLTWEVRA